MGTMEDGLCNNQKKKIFLKRSTKNDRITCTFQKWKCFCGYESLPLQ